ncbi:LysR family transcriptional regulator [Caulobacter sp. UC70_42]|uniref:LysR family transcriptional regulator n=1 Tax=Caulobacter sp. UC70_42 TaxID=3374551 RepID=UPI0037563273
MPHLPDFEAWAIFAKVAERGSFSAAAEELGLAKTTVSKAVTRLEERMRTTLLHRTTRQLSLTESGRASLDRALRILNDGEAVEAEILEEAAIPRGLIRLACTGAFGVRTLAPLIPEFLKRYPEIELDLQITDTKIDLIADGFDGVIKVGQLADSSMRASRLFSHRLPVVGAPALFDRYGRPEQPEDILKMPIMVYTHVREAQEWRFFHPVHGERLVMVQGSIRMNNGLAAVPVLLEGLAITLQPEVYIWNELQEGRLEEVLKEWTLVPVPVHLVTPPGRARPARLRVLLEFLRENFSKQPWAHGIEH